LAEAVAPFHVQIANTLVQVVLK
jgi:DNA-binding protein YbaB